MAASLPPELARLLEAPDPATSEEAWSRFLNKYSPLLLATARKFGRDYDSAMDRYMFILEELRRADCHRLRSYNVQARSRFTTWLVVVARRLCLDYARKRYGRESGSDSSPAKGTSGVVRRRLADLVVEELRPASLSGGSETGGERALRQTQLHEALHRVIASLSRRDRLLLKLRFEDDRSVREIAALLKYPSIFHVYRRLKPLLRDIRAELEARGFDDATP